MTYLLLLLLFLPETVLSRQECGGTFRGTQGVLSTPNFPEKFETPIDCVWVIEASDGPNFIFVYLTQLYVFEGFTLTEYDVYDERFPTEGTVVFSANEENIVDAMYAQVDKKYLVITLKLDSIEGTHLRVLGRHLNAHGFNITYEIASTRRENSCMASMCGFTGNCYDNFKEFYCQCFPGYSGNNCSEGKSSRCVTNGQSTCKNDSTCMHIGEFTVQCICKSGFTGPYCDIPIAKLPYNSVCEDCLISCPFDGTLGNVCKCRKGRSTAVNDSIGFSSTVFISNVTSFKGTDLKKYLSKTIRRLLVESNFTNIERVQISYLEEVKEGIHMTFRFYGPKRDERRIKAVINKWKYNGAIGNISLAQREDFFITTDPYLHLQRVSVNNADDIHVNEEFILSCEARGSRNMNFRWFRNDVLINVTPAVSNKWNKLIPEKSSDHYTAVLVIERATKMDEGVFTCQVEDYGIQQCRSRKIVLKHQPVFTLEPKSLTVNKGEPFNITCNPVTGKYSYSWTKDKLLLAKKSGTEQYEVLYPRGSVLQVAGINKTTTYSCLVQDGKLSSEKSVTVNVIDRSIVIPCSKEKIEDVLWPETAPETDSMCECPKNYTGIVSRGCIFETGRPKWLLPNYSNCTANELLMTIGNFRALTHGYEQTTPLETALKVAQYVNDHVLLRGEGAGVLDIIYNVCSYNNASNISDVRKLSDAMFDTMDGLLGQIHSMNKEEQLIFLQIAIKTQLTYLAQYPGSYFFSMEHLTISVEDCNDCLFDHMGAINKKMRAVYNNLHTFLPATSVIRFSEDLEIEYEIISSIAAIWLSNDNDNCEVSGRHFCNSIFMHKMIENRPEWEVSCGLAILAGSQYAWDTAICISYPVNSTATICNCSQQGTIALLLVKAPKMMSRDMPHPPATILLIGCSVSIIILSLCMFLLLWHWNSQKSPYTFLKLQCCVSMSATMTVFIVAFTKEVPEEYYLLVATLLLAFFLMGLATQLTVLLIIYSEIVERHKTDKIKYTVNGIICGSVVMSVFVFYITHRTKDIHLNSWWLQSDTMSFKYCTFFITLQFVLFGALSCLVVKLIKGNKTSGSRFLHSRMKLLRKTTVIFNCIVLLATTSLFCVNNVEDVIWHYAFAAVSVLTMLILAICYLTKSHFLIKGHLMEKFSLAQKVHENETGNSPKAECGVSDMQVQTTNSAELSPCIHHYPTSPAHCNHPVIKSRSLHSPDILGTKVFAELDLVASSLQSVSQIPSSPLVNTHSKITIAITKEPMKVAGEKVVKFCDNKQTITKARSSEQLDAVMDSISNDLNYLLNGHIELQEQNVSSHTSTLLRLQDDEIGIPC